MNTIRGRLCFSVCTNPKASILIQQWRSFDKLTLQDDWYVCQLYDAKMLNIRFDQ